MLLFELDYLLSLIWEIFYVKKDFFKVKKIIIPSKVIEIAWEEGG